MQKMEFLLIKKNNNNKNHHTKKGLVEAHKNKNDKKIMQQKIK